MIPFLQETAKDIYQNHHNSKQRICIVFPNKRTRMFFRKYYSEIIGKASFPMKMTDIRLLVKNISQLHEPDSLSLNYDLFEIFKKQSKSNDVTYTFDKFYRIGEIILNDFNEIDSWLVDPNQIFKTIKDTNEIDTRFDWLSEEQKTVLKNFWVNFSPEKQSEEKKKFLEIWNLLPEIYLKLKEFLLNRKLAYNGLVFRYISEMISANSLQLNDFDLYIFIGFNALSKGEETIFSHIKDIGKALFYWDTDVYYQLNSKQEAGDFLRKNFRNLSIKTENLPNNLIGQPKEIETLGIPMEIGQAKMIPSLFESFSSEYKINDTAIVLSDEHLLFPVLHSLPQDIDKINITMGYPLKATSLFTLIEHYLFLQNTFSITSQKYKTYHYTNVLSILRHPFIYLQNIDFCKEIIQRIEDGNIVHVPAADLIENSGDLIRYLFSPLPDNYESETLLTNLLKILFILFDKKLDENQKIIPTLENEYIHRTYLAIKRFKEVLTSKNISPGLLMTIDLLRKHLTTIQIPFSGEAVEGLQLMGVLETRNLDFKNVILLGMNEGNFPSITQPSSFLSQSIRYVFGLPMVKFQDSVYAYFFYRLIQRAEKITFIYNSINSGNTGEISRFIQQLQFESGLEIKHRQFKQDIVSTVGNPISVCKTPNVLQELTKYYSTNNYSVKRLSASAINTFINCSLQFYFRYIVELKSPKTVEEDITPATFGTILHSAVEKLYSNLILLKKSRLIEKNDFAAIRSEKENSVNHAFKVFYGIPESSEFHFTGSQSIIKEVIIKYLEIILEVDQNYAPFEIISMEGKTEYKSGYTAEIKIIVNEQTQNIGVKGIIDRVDKKNDVFRVIDYKTGTVEKFYSGFENILANETDLNNNAILQTFLYGYLFSYKNPETPVFPGIYDIRAMKSLDYKPNLTIKTATGQENINIDEFYFRTELPHYLEYLSGILSKLFDPNINFEQVEDKNKCKYCDFKNICKI